MAERKFTLFHLNLVPIRQRDIETWEGTREEWLRHALAQPFNFEHRAGRRLYWVPKEPADSSIVGILEIERDHEHHEPPERGGAEVVSTEWQGAYILLDPTTHDEGQRAAVENDIAGTPNAILKSLVNSINARHDKPFEIEVEPIFDSANFWEFSKKHNNILRQIIFDFIVPNMWGAESDLEKDLEDTGKETGAQRVTVEFQSKEGVSTQNQKVRDGVEYAEKGAGNLKAKSLDNKPFSSTEKPKTTKIPMPERGADLAEGIRQQRSQVLGHEKTTSLDNPTDSGSDTAGD
ncbi:hypothetical protein [Marinicauda salina]|uniref:hypothetical protein n=1 Tax=Marinicauda salina TaxID=2135793 RepID=UPI0011B23815|nr:hypothetical protein [Marinicauda salina]